VLLKLTSILYYIRGNSMATLTPVQKTNLNASQVMILQALAKSDEPLSKEDIEKVAPNAAVSAINLGPVFQETLEGANEGNGAWRYSDSLYALGYVRPVKDNRDDKEVTCWEITAKGRKLVDKLVTRTKAAGNLKIPPEILDPIILKMRAVRTYGLNVWTDTDVKELRDKLPEEYRTISIENLRHRIVQRRQAGAFADPSKKRRMSIEKVLREFGPDGTVLQLLSNKQVDVLEEELTKIK
jgi:hypothetical protein